MTTGIGSTWGETPSRAPTGESRGRVFLITKI